MQTETHNPNDAINDPAFVAFAAKLPDNLCVPPGSSAEAYNKCFDALIALPTQAAKAREELFDLEAKHRETLRSRPKPIAPSPAPLEAVRRPSPPRTSAPARLPVASGECWDDHARIGAFRALHNIAVDTSQASRWKALLESRDQVSTRVPWEALTGEERARLHRTDRARFYSMATAAFGGAR